MPSYTIPPNSHIVKLIIDNGAFPLICPNYKIQNIGTVEVDARTIYGTEFGWIGTVNEEIVKPGNTKVIDNFRKVYYVLGLKIINHTDTTATVIASYDNDIQTTYLDNIQDYYLKKYNVPKSRNLDVVYIKHTPKIYADDAVSNFKEYANIKKFDNLNGGVISNTQPLVVMYVRDNNLSCKL